MGKALSGGADGEGRSRRGWLILLLVGVNAMWGTTDFAAKIAIRDLTPGLVAWLRFSVALLIFIPILVRRRAEIPQTARGLAPFFFLGACGFFVNFLLNYHGLRLAPACHATALRVTEALAIAFLSWLILRERIGKRALLGMVMGVIGVGLVLEVDVLNLDLFGEGYRLGDLMIIGGILVEGLYTVAGKKVLEKYRPLTATALACACGWLLLTLSLLPEIATLSASPPGLASIAACIYMGVVATAAGYSIWYWVLAREQSHRVGMTIMVQPVVGIPLAALVLGEKISPGFVAGAALIGAGVYLVLGRVSTDSEDSAGAEIRTSPK